MSCRELDDEISFVFFSSFFTKVKILKGRHGAEEEEDVFIETRNEPFLSLCHRAFRQTAVPAEEAKSTSASFDERHSKNRSLIVTSSYVKELEDMRPI